MNKQLIVSVYLLGYQLSQMGCNLVSFDVCQVIGMDRVWHLILILKSHINGLWVVDLLWVSRKLRINLHMKDWNIICIQLIEDNREPWGDLILFWRVPAGQLRKMHHHLLVYSDFHKEGLGRENCNRSWCWFELKFKGIASQCHCVNIIKLNCYLLRI